MASLYFAQDDPGLQPGYRQVEAPDRYYLMGSHWVGWREELNQRGRVTPLR